MAKFAVFWALCIILLLACLQTPTPSAVLWFSGCDSLDGWTTATTPVSVHVITVHTAPGAFGWNTSNNRIYSTFPDTPAGSELVLRFWFNDASTSSQGGNAPCIELRKADLGTTSVINFCLNNFPGNQLLRYQFRCLGGAGGTGYYNGSVSRSMGWHRVEMRYPGGLNPFTWTLDGVTHFTRTPTAPLSFGSVSIGLGAGSTGCTPPFRVDTMAVMDAPRKLAFATSPAGGSIEVSLTTPSGLQTGVLADNHKDGYYDAAEVITLAAPAIDGLGFSSWTSTCGGTFGNPNAANTTFTAASGDGTITANYVGGCAPPSASTAVERISGLWGMPNDGTVCKLSGKTVTAVWTDGFWVEESDRSSAVRVLYPTGACAVGGAIAAGSSVDVYGTLSTGDTRVLTASVVVDNGTGNSVEPIEITARYSGGKGINPDTPAVTASNGVYSIGLLARMAGCLNQDLTSGAYYLDDGSGLVDGSAKGIKVISLSPPPTGSRVVTGVIGAIGGKPVIYVTDVR